MGNMKQPFEIDLSLDYTVRKFNKTKSIKNIQLKKQSTLYIVNPNIYYNNFDIDLMTTNASQIIYLTKIYNELSVFRIDLKENIYISFKIIINDYISNNWLADNGVSHSNINKLITMYNLKIVDDVTHINYLKSLTDRTPEIIYVCGR
ncbi:hypothetical protein ACTFIY_001896 [Dictyostelium cf. discoideum]